MLHATQSILGETPITGSLAATPPIIDPDAILVPDDIPDDILQDIENDRIDLGLHNTSRIVLENTWPCSCD